MKKKEDLKDMLSRLLKKDTRGLTLTQLAKLTKFSTITVSKRIAELKGEGNIEIRPAGSAKLHYWKSKKRS